MKNVAVPAVLFAGLAFVVAVLVHYISRVPLHYTCLQDLKMETGVDPHPCAVLLVRPSWWPAIPGYTAIGLILGVLVGWATDRLGLDLLVRRKQRDSSDIPASVSSG
jgi:MFS superfamily sulfate permease-like transporter